MILGCVQEACGPISNAFQKNRGALKIRVFPNTIMKQSRLFIFQWQDDPIQNTVKKNFRADRHHMSLTRVLALT